MQNETRECKYYDASDLMNILGIGKNKAYDLIKKIPHIKIGKIIRVNVKDFDDYMNSIKTSC